MPVIYNEKNVKLNQKNITDHIYISLNLNRNIPRERILSNGRYKGAPANFSISLYDWLTYLTKKDSPISSGSFSSPSAAFSGGLTEGDIYYDSTSKTLKVIMGKGAYADDTTAGSNGVAVGEHYFNTTSNSYVTRMA